MPGPDFLGIGAQRAGTSWLYTVLERHPALWLPPLKELHYFDDPLSENRHRYYGFLRARITAGLWLRRPLSAWDLHYFCGRRSDDWYCRLFEAGKRKGRLTGEITPSYATLDKEAFLRMRTLNPEVKIIFIMRDPIMRSWSSIIKSREKHGAFKLPTTSEAIDHSQREGVIRKSSYTETIAKLDRVFERDQVFYGFFEEMVGQPSVFMKRVLTFLDVEPREFKNSLPADPVGAAAGGRRPPLEFERFLVASFMPEVEKLCARFEGPPHTWQARYEALLNA
jgi:hypothetical protein